MLSSDDGTEFNGQGGVEEGVGFQVDTEEDICCSIAKSVDVANLRCELGDVVQVYDLPGEWWSELWPSTKTSNSQLQGQT